ncbi:hypothetical protein QUB60_12490 [Microcoleus sp. A2-C5]|uniref:hypothetical protein n=1 Tax=Microcoleaceae TaxID=1892252 RepID=UPI002237217A|nr:hypothetical protein [Lyngbya sp. CCAP 1446/10]
MHCLGQCSPLAGCSISNRPSDGAELAGIRKQKCDRASILSVHEGETEIFASYFRLLVHPEDSTFNQQRSVNPSLFCSLKDFAPGLTGAT